LERFYVGEVYINHKKLPTLLPAGFLKKGQETGQIPGCSFYLPIFMSWDATVPYYCTQPVCDPVVTGGLAVWWHHTPRTKTQVTETDILLSSGLQD